MFGSLRGWKQAQAERGTVLTSVAAAAGDAEPEFRSGSAASPCRGLAGVGEERQSLRGPRLTLLHTAPVPRRLLGC